MPASKAGSGNCSYAACPEGSFRNKEDSEGCDFRIFQALGPKTADGCTLKM